MWQFGIRSTAFAAAIMAGFTSSQAAEITVTHSGTLDVVHLSGKINGTDAGEFERASEGLGEKFNRNTIVLLDSPGGSVIAAMKIGENIRARGFAAGVVNEAMCASACALIWMAGVPRFLGNSAKLGFHAAYELSNDDKKESGAGNALVGAYLAKLGFGYDAIYYATVAGPDQMQWLHPADARRVGIKVETFPDPVTSKPVVPAPSPADATQPEQRLPDQKAPEQRARKLMTDYYALWSRSGINVEALARFYGDVVVFYGERKNRESIMVEKRKFSVRWPIRQYTVNENMVLAQCSDTCTVTGVVQWDVSSPERNAHSVGSANFVVKIALNAASDGGVILSENGAVLSVSNSPLVPGQALPTVAPSSPQASAVPNVSPLFALGRKMRSEYEAWFNSLPDDEFRKGAEFWAQNRSLKVPPSCMQPDKNAAWRSGCAAGQQHLLYSDALRNSDREFRLGWNSL